MEKRTLVLLICVITFGLFLASHALAADSFWIGSIYKVVTTSDGDTILQLDPVQGVPGQIVNGRSKVTIVGTDPGANQMLATVLTALSLNKYIAVLVDSEPTLQYAPYVKRVSLVNE